MAKKPKKKSAAIGRRVTPARPPVVVHDGKMAAAGPDN